MTKRELVIQVSEKLGFTQNEVSSVVQAALDEIVDCLVDGQRLEVRNFGVFEVKTRDARIGRNPRTGEEVPIAGKRVPSFKPGKALKDRVQNGSSAPDNADNVIAMNTATPETGHAPAVNEDRETGASL